MKNQATMRFVTLGLLFLVAVSLAAGPAEGRIRFHARKDRALKDFEVPPLTHGDLGELASEVSALRDEIRNELLAKGKKGRKIDHHEHMVACGYILNELSEISSLLESTRPGAAGREDLGGRYLRAMRVLYSVEADRVEQTKNGILDKIGSPLVMGVRVTGSPLVIRIPYRDPDETVGGARAQVESPGLYDETGRKVSQEDLAGMTHRQVSRFELSPRSRVFNSFSKLEGPARFKALEKFIAGLVRRYDPDLADFDIERARRVFFFKSVKGTATSPKILVEDSWGLPWKMKWGDEVHTENFMARFYMALGAKYSDLKYYLPFRGAPVVLDRPDKDGKGENGGILYLHQLEKALLESRFKFHLERYVPEEGLVMDSRGRPLGHGTVDEEFCARYGIKKKHIGAWYVFFKEASMTFYAPSLKRVGPAPFSQLGAEENRAARGSVVFNCFFNNKDCKDDNNNLGLVYNPQIDNFDRVVEYQHDLGCSLGGLQTSGDLNTFGWDFIARFPGFLGFKMRTLYYPDAWKAATFADALWMARKIADVPPEVYKWALAESGWPSFCQKLAYEKLMSRRNEMIDTFGLQAEGYRKTAVDRNLDMEVHLPDGTIDFPVRNGAISTPDRSRLVAEEEKLHHPEGLHKVVPRGRD